MTGREQILAAVRTALADVPADEPATWRADGDPDPAVAYARGGSEPGADELVARFAQRCGEYQATVTRCEGDADAIRAAVAAVSARHGVRVLAVAPGLPAEWIPGETAVRLDDPPLALPELDGCDGALTGCALAIAETGTIALDGGPGQGRRALTLVPDLHVCVVLAAAVVGSVPEAIARLGVAVTEHGAPVTFVSGPSATSDIELERVEGVHGPRRFEVVVAG